jgi:hypothetical protein
MAVLELATWPGAYDTPLHAALHAFGQTHSYPINEMQSRSERRALENDVEQAKLGAAFRAAHIHTLNRDRKSS